jgi:hypothetical protein
MALFSAATLARLGLQPTIAQASVSGLGGLAPSVVVTTQRQLTHEACGTSASLKNYTTAARTI